MASSRSLLLVAILAVGRATLSLALEAHETSVLHQPSTHRVRHVSRELKYTSYHPKTTANFYGEGITSKLKLSQRGEVSLNATARDFVSSELGLDVDAVGYVSGYVQGDMKFAYVKQFHDGIPFVNAVANVAWKGKKVISFGSSFVKPLVIAPSTPTIPISSIIAKAESALTERYNNFPTSLAYLMQADGSAALVHAIQIRNEETNAWYSVQVDAHRGEILSATDYTADATYVAVPFHKQCLPEGRETISEPQDRFASPNGWHNGPHTSGNNVLSVSFSDGRFTTESAPGLFNYTHSPALDPPAASNRDVARVNAFYVANSLHDLTYRYGFTESAFNFQADNFGKGGRGGDPVHISVQDQTGVDNARFSAPPDGQPGVAMMFLWQRGSPMRDSSLANDLLIHELTHGITMRMTGGGSGACLQTEEAGGLGEGWSDAMANWAHQTDGDAKDFVIGAYLRNENGMGLRSVPYSTNRQTNNLLYSSIRGANGKIHRIGEVWAEILHIIYALLIQEHGWSASARTNPGGSEGNIVWLHLFMDALPLQPCEPTFLSARDAWIQADINRYGGVNRCTLWRGFASRGLGSNARPDYTDGYDVPQGCSY